MLGMKAWAKASPDEIMPAFICLGHAACAVAQKPNPSWRVRTCVARSMTPAYCGHTVSSVVYYYVMYILYISDGCVCGVLSRLYEVRTG